VFALGNALFTLATLFTNEALIGFGFVAAAGLGLLVAGCRLNQRIGHIECHVCLPERA
ncbi:MAG: hypothetical protein HKN23_11455, partial [Verrucomicrobiales bacterium]|nr:hypothetical protein [Verrucomicrobiales bacterium]